MSESSIIICATTESKSRKSRKWTIGSLVQIFKNSSFDFLYGPSNHPERTKQKHELALSQAIHTRKTKAHVHLILLIPENQEYPHMTDIHKKASESGIEITVIPKDSLEFIRQAALYRFQRQQWDMRPDAA